MDLWLGNRKRILVLNREDMISTADRNAWAMHFSRQGIKVVFSNGQLGMVYESDFDPFTFLVLKIVLVTYLSEFGKLRGL